MSDMETMLDHCGFDSAFELIKHHYTEEELMDLLEELVNRYTVPNAVRDAVQEIATEHYEFVDWEQIKADADDAKIQAWRDRRHGDE